jgi:cell division protein FtsB
MGIFSNINWTTVLLTLALVIIIYNLAVIVRSAMVKRQADEEIKKIDAKIAAIRKELEEAKKTFFKS